jgi:hypothetical protein
MNAIGGHCLRVIASGGGLSVPNGSSCAVIRSDNVTHPIIGEVKGVTDIPIPDHLARPRGRIFSLPRTQMVRRKGIRVSDRYGEPRSRNRQTAHNQRPAVIFLRLWVMSMAATFRHRRRRIYRRPLNKYLTPTACENFALHEGRPKTSANRPLPKRGISDELLFRPQLFVSPSLKCLEPMMSPTG